MSKTEYGKARKKAQKVYRSQLLRGTYPYLQALDDIVSFAEIVSETELGLIEIPLDAVVGTKTAGRKQAFASNFMPLLDDNTEFAHKWISLYQAHISEGIRDPVIAVEFMNRFYVVEGNKRVSVLKYVDAVSIQAYVTRLLPQKSDSKENRIYYEFLDFYKLSEVNYLNFSQEGCYLKILDLIGKKPEEVWTEDEKINFRSAYIHFLDIFNEKGGGKLPITPGDAFLTYLEIYGYKDILEKSYKELREEIPAIWKDFEIYPAKRSVELVMAPQEKSEEKTLMTRLLPPSSPVKIAFVHDRSPEASSWTYGHELGRHYLDNAFAGRIITSSYITNGNPEEGSEDIRLVGTYGRMFHAHEHCFDEYTEQVKSGEIKEAQAPNNTLRGLLGAILGSLAGCIIWALMFLFTDYFVVIVAFLISMGAAFMWGKFGGKNNKTKIAVVWAVSIIMMLLTMLASYLIFVAVSVDGNVFENFIYNLQVTPSFRSLVIVDTLISFVFIIVANVYMTINVLKTQKLESQTLIKY